jgi:hypothetical protein
VVAIAPLIGALLIPSPIPPLTRALAGLLWVLCIAPGIVYSGLPPSRRRPLPFIPTVGVAFGLYFVLPVVLGAYNHYYRVEVNPVTDYDLPVQLALIGWVIMLGSYLVTGALRSTSRPSVRPSSWDEADVSIWGLVLLFGAISLTVAKSIFAPGLGSPAIMQFILSIQWLGIGFLTVAARRRVLGKLQWGLFAAGAAITIGSLLGAGSIAPVVQMAAVVAYALWLSGMRVRPRWIAIGALIMAFAVSARGVAIDFRNIAWIGHLRLSPTERAQLMLSLISSKIETEGLVATLQSGANSTFERSADMDLFADVVRRTPGEVPYWNGYTYASLVGSFVPRVLWPDKPTKEVGQAFGHRYRYLYWTNVSTSINLPFLVEFYANFGAIGVIVGMAIVGLIYRILDELVNHPEQDLLASLIGVIILVPLLMLESDFSLTFGGLVLNGLAFFVITSVIRRNAARSIGMAVAPGYTMVVRTNQFGGRLVQIEPTKRTPRIGRGKQ